MRSIPSRRRFLAGLSAAAAGLVGCRRDPAAPAAEARPPASASSHADTADPADDFPALVGRCDGAEPIAAAEYEARQERARARCRDRGLGGILCEAGASLRYFTGVRWGLSERPLLWALPVAGDPFFVGPAFEARTVGEQLGGGAAYLPWEEHESAFAIAGARLRERGVRRFAVDPEARLFLLEGLRAAASPGVAFEIDDGVIAGLRSRKSPAELALLRRANEATKAALAAVLDRVRVGASEPEIAATVHAALAAAGLGETWALVLAGPNASFPHGTREARTLADGDVLLIDAGGSLHGYRSDISRSALVGEVAPAHLRIWEVVREAQAAALALLRPGVIVSDVDAAARAVIDGAGFGPAYHRFTHRLGHGIGLQVHEAPYLVMGARTLLEPGMVMSVEPGIYVPGEVGVRIEDIVAITDDGVEVFGERVTDPPRIAG